MNKNRFFSIGNKISVIVIILFVVIITLFYLYNNFITYPTLQEEKVNRIKEIASFFRDDTLIMLSFEDLEGVTDVLKKIDSIENILKMDIKDRNNRLITTYSKIDIESTKSRFLNEIKLINKPTPHFLYFYNLDKNYYMVIYYSAKSYLETINDYQKFTILISLLILIIISIFSILIRRLLSPFTKLANTIYNLNFDNFKYFKLENSYFNDERGLIINSIQNMLDKIESTLNRVKNEIEKNRQKDKLMFQQARLAQMGEMIGNIAHQWRQPLNEIGLVIQSFELAYFKGKLNEKFIEDRVAEGDELIENMSNTIDDFRNFFSPNKEKHNFKLNKAIKKSIQMIKASLINNNITLIECLDNDIKTFGYENEFEQVILNILSNAKDILLEKNTLEKVILIQSKVELSNDLKYALIEVYDSGNGIKEEIMDRVFEPYFTTKEEGKGTGIGLYMSKNIIENMHGKLSILNREFKINKKVYFGAYFSIKIPI